jgi:pimeloyl-[acyl-carrier protein] synthase
VVKEILREEKSLSQIASEQGVPRFMAAALSIFDLMDPQVLANPYPFYDKLRQSGPVVWDEFFKGWICGSYKEVTAALRDSRLAANRVTSEKDLIALGLAELAPLYFRLTDQLLFIDGPKHTRLRGLISKVFTPARIEKMKTYLQELVDQMLAEASTRGRMDVIHEIAYPLPVTVIAELLGVPTEDLEQLKKWSDDYAAMLGSFQYIPDNPEEVLDSLQAMTNYFLTIIQGYRNHPNNTLLSDLVIAQEQNQRLDNDELLANCILLLAAGHETTTNLIGNAVLTLLRHPDQLTWLRDDPSLIEGAIEEVLRFESPAQYTVRKAREDVELGGKIIRKNQAIILLLGAANRDPEQFSDPANFDIRRTNNRHISFGYAAHFCVGAPLARLEARTALATMLARFPHLRLASTEVTWRENKNLRGLATLPVTFDPPQSPIG